jgi:UDP-4-keto-D-QuiNAc 4-reductase
MRAIELGIPLPFGSIDNRRSMIGTENLINFIEICIVHPRAPGRTWLVSDGEDLPTPELVTRLARLMGRRAPLFPFPPGLLGIFGRALGRGKEIERLTSSLQVDIDPAIAGLNWRPSISVDQELARTVASFEMEQKWME